MGRRRPSLTSILLQSFRWPQLVIRIRRALILARWRLRQSVQDQLDRLLQLRIAALPPQFRVELDFDVGRHAFVFHLPFAFGCPEGEVRRSYAAAIDQRWIPADADQSAPSAFPDHRPEFVPLKCPGQIIAARTGMLVCQHHLRPEDLAGRRRVISAMPGGPQIQKRPIQAIDDPVRRLAAAVEPLVNDDGLLIDLGEEVAVEVGESPPLPCRADRHTRLGPWSCRPPFVGSPRSNCGCAVAVRRRLAPP